ncbi:MAG: hypothetical protein IANPNBLG_01433 [Bryobacteraceae bacterium]|nr:hypothetical protein [Bryobacteraceae bacterium]
MPLTLAKLLRSCDIAVGFAFGINTGIVTYSDNLQVDRFAVIVTAPGRQVDFVSRFFAPAGGVPEDPVTGSAHCTLTPYWSKRLARTKLHARQVSARGGELFCEDRGERVSIAGSAVLFLEGTILL